MTKRAKSEKQIAFAWYQTQKAYTYAIKRYSEAERTEALRIARNLVKDELKRQGVKISFVEVKEITKACKALIAADPRITLTVARRRLRYGK